MDRLAKAGASELAGYVALQLDVWLAITFEPGDINDGMLRIVQELRALEETERRAVTQIEAQSSRQLMDAALGQPPETILFVVGIEKLSDDQLRDFDRARNQLLGRTILFCTTDEGVEELATLCPNVYSWIAGQCFSFDFSEGVMNVEERLESLRKHYRLSDADVIQRAERNQLPADPAFVEWLALLGRGDLLGS